VTQQVLYAIENGEIIMWQDTSQYNYAAPTSAQALLTVTADQWATQSTPQYVSNPNTSNAALVDGTAPLTAKEMKKAATAQYQLLTSAGITITSTGTPAVNGTYGVAPGDQENFDSAEIGINNNIVTFPLTWELLGSTSAVSIPNSTVFLEIAKAAFDFVQACIYAADTAAAGGTPTWPSPDITIS
jgi:hypothetical protein